MSWVGALIDKRHNDVLRGNVNMDASPIRILRTREKLSIILVWSQEQIPYQILLVEDLWIFQKNPPGVF